MGHAQNLSYYTIAIASMIDRNNNLMPMLMYNPISNAIETNEIPHQSINQLHDHKNLELQIASVLAMLLPGITFQ
jgi:hypothetical protein